MKLTYSEDVDIAYIKFESGKYDVSQELSHGVVVDMTKSGKILGFEIYEASKRLPNFIKKTKDVVKAQQVVSN